MNLVAVSDMKMKFPKLEIILIESGGDNLAATFSPELADITIYVIDVSAGEKIPRKGGPGITRSDLFVINKIDLSTQDEIADYIDSWKQELPNASVLPISALNGFNLEQIKEHILENIPESPPYYDKDTITDKSERFFIEEIIREKILKHYKKEIPYSVEVEVEEFFEEEEIIKIRAIIYVLRESQKGILIGHKGLGLKRIGTEARRDIEVMLDKKVYLETPIKVNKNWRNDNKQLKKFGYE